MPVYEGVRVEERGHRMRVRRTSQSANALASLVLQRARLREMMGWRWTRTTVTMKATSPLAKAGAVAATPLLAVVVEARASQRPP